MSVAARTKTVTWEDPRILAEASTSGGLAFMRAIASGELPPPPIAQLMGFGIDEVSEGRAVFRAEPGEEHYNPIGMVHGGVAATLLDSCMGCAVHTLLPEGFGYTTLELSVNYIRAIHADAGPIVATGEVVHPGRTVATAEGRIVVERTGKLVAHAKTTILVVPAPG